MTWRPLLKFYRYAFARENYRLLARTIRAAWHVRRALRDVAGTRDITPQLKAALPLIPSLYLSPQPGWKISDAETVARFAHVATLLPVRWGRCLQRSLIAWRLLNGYRIPAYLCIGISKNNPNEGHVWITRDAAGCEALFEMADPREHFTLIYVSPEPPASLPSPCPSPTSPAVERASSL